MMASPALSREALAAHREAGTPMFRKPRGPDKGWYVADVYCGNCDFGGPGSTQEIVLMRGLPVAEAPCPSCGLRMLRRERAVKVRTAQYRDVENRRRREARAEAA